MEKGHFQEDAYQQVAVPGATQKIRLQLHMSAEKEDKVVGKSNKLLLKTKSSQGICQDGVLLLLREAFCTFWSWCYVWNNNTLPRHLSSKRAAVGSWAPAWQDLVLQGPGDTVSVAICTCASESELQRGLSKPSFSFLALGCPSGMLKIQRIIRMDPSASLYSVFPV